MPHALFLGSSLAGVDRLNMQPRLPEPPNYMSRSISHKLPSVFRRRKSPNREVDPESEYEMDAMDRPSSGVSASYQRPGMSEVEVEQRVGKDEVLVRGRSNETLDAEMKRYEAEMKSFDRIKWVDIHLRHATVSFVFIELWAEPIDPRSTRRSVCWALH
jgi:metal iron transporter